MRRLSQSFIQEQNKLECELRPSVLSQTSENFMQKSYLKHTYDREHTNDMNVSKRTAIL